MVLEEASGCIIMLLWLVATLFLATREAGECFSLWMTMARKTTVLVLFPCQWALSMPADTFRFENITCLLLAPPQVGSRALVSRRSVGKKPTVFCKEFYKTLIVSIPV